MDHFLEVKEKKRIFKNLCLESDVINLTYANSNVSNTLIKLKCQ